MGWLNIPAQLSAILTELQTLNANITQLTKTYTQREDKVLTAMDELEAAVTEQTDVIASVTTLLDGISQQLSDALAAADPAAIQAVVDQVKANTQRLADAVAAHTTTTG